MRVATRASPLALRQTAEIERLLAAAGLGADLEVVPVRTTGDRLAEVSLAEVGGKGAFTSEVSYAVSSARVDFAVHSAKDLPSVLPQGLCIAAVPRRADVRDALVGCSLAELPPGALVATGSARRRVQLAKRRGDLRFADLRGNIHTRLRKAAAFDAVVMAMAALERLGIQPEDLFPLTTEEMVPQAGQGALVLECRSADEEVRELLAVLEHAPSRRCVEAERSFLAGIGGDCSIPAGAHAVISNGRLCLTAVLAEQDGEGVCRDFVEGDDPAELGYTLAQRLLARARRP